MTVQDEMEMRERITAHWQNIGKEECHRRRTLMKEAAALSSYFATGLVRVSKFNGDALDRLQVLFQKAERRYQRRAVSYYGE